MTRREVVRGGGVLLGAGAAGGAALRVAMAMAGGPEEPVVGSPEGQPTQPTPIVVTPESGWPKPELWIENRGEGRILKVSPEMVLQRLSRTERQFFWPRQTYELTIGPANSDPKLVYVDHSGLYQKHLTDKRWDQVGATVDGFVPERVFDAGGDRVIVGAGLPTKGSHRIWGGWVLTSRDFVNWEVWPEGPPVFAWINDIVQAPNGEIVVGGTRWADGEPVWRTAGESNSWDEAGSRDVGSGLPDYIMGLAVDAVDPNLMYAVAGGLTLPSRSDVALGGIYRSRDGGETWDLRIRFGEEALWGGLVAAHPSESQVGHFAANVNDGQFNHPFVFSSVDGFGRFDEDLYVGPPYEVTEGLPLDGVVSGLAVTTSHVYVAIQGNDPGLYRREHATEGAFEMVGNGLPGGADLSGCMALPDGESILAWDKSRQLWVYDENGWREAGSLPGTKFYIPLGSGKNFSSLDAPPRR